MCTGVADGVFMTDLGQARQFGQTMTWLREARCVRAAALIAAVRTPLGRGGACVASTATCWLGWSAAIPAR
jgi:hypothetical protein